EPIAIGVSPLTPCTLTTAISLVGSAPTTVNGAVRPSWKVTVVLGAPPPPPGGPPGTPGGGMLGPDGPDGPVGADGPDAGLGFAAAETTWLLVMISPSADRMMPEPSSDCRPRSVSSMTTLGTTLLATCSTLPGGMFAAGTLGAAPGIRPPAWPVPDWLPS